MPKTTRRCATNGCDRKHLAKGLCAYHYRVAHPPKKDKPVACPTCGTVTMKRETGRAGTKATGFCSLFCRDLWRCEQPDDPMHAPGSLKRKPRNAAPKLSRLPTDHVVMVEARRLTEAKRLERGRAARGPIRAAYEDGDWAALRLAIEAETVKVDSCWLWSRQTDKKYGRITFGVKQHFVHRLMMTALLDGKLDPSLPVHHRCAETLCCNPGHLQLVTQRENVAEMLERRYYVERIDRLETALRSMAPSHPALHPWRDDPRSA